MRREKEQYSRATRRQMEKAEKMKAREDARRNKKHGKLYKAFCTALAVPTIIVCGFLGYVLVTMNTEVPTPDVEESVYTITLADMLAPTRLTRLNFDDDTTGKWKSATLIYPDLSADTMHTVTQQYIREEFKQGDAVHGIFDIVDKVTCRVTRLGEHTFEYQFYDYVEYEEYSASKCFCGMTDGRVYLFNTRNNYFVDASGETSVDFDALYQ